MLSNNKNGIFRISLPSKGRLAEDCLNFMAEAGLSIYKPNPRQYEATIPALPELKVLFQRPADIASSVQDGSVEFGITGLDVVAESQNNSLTQDIFMLHDALGFGGCSLTLAIPEQWATVTDLDSLSAYCNALNRPVKVATKYENLTSSFLSRLALNYHLVSSEGTLEIAPAIGYADFICDIVSSGLTLRDNRLKPISGGEILQSQAVLIGNAASLVKNPQLVAIARTLIEFFEAHLIATQKLAIFANMRGDSAAAIAKKIFESTSIAGLQGPTISPVYVNNDSNNWFAVNIIVARDNLFHAISELRKIGGSGVIVMPVTYVFDEVPPRYASLLENINQYKTR